MSSQAPPPPFDAYLALAGFLFAKERSFSGLLDEWLSAQPYTEEQKDEVRRAYEVSGGPPAQTGQAPRWP
jgi:hypothetical protein